MNPKVRDAVQAAIDRCFQMNALCDRMVYIMLGPWYMQRFGSAFHEGVAHAYPAIADKLSDVLLAEHEVVTRGTVVPQAQDYAGPTEMMAEYRDAVLETRRIIGDAYYIAFDNAEAGAATLLEDILEDYQEDMVPQAYLLAGKVAQYANNFAQIDGDYNIFFG